MEQMVQVSLIMILLNYFKQNKNESRTIVHDPEAIKLAWERTITFFKSNL